MAYDLSRWHRLGDEILSLRALMGGLRERLDGPRQQQLKLLNQLSRAQTKREQRVGAPLPDDVTAAQIHERGPEIRGPRGFHRPPAQTDFDLEIVALRDEKIAVDREIAGLDLKMREASSRLGQLTQLKQAVEAWAAAAGVALPGAELQRVTVTMPAPSPRTEVMLDASGRPFEGTGR
jgi:hypothetical protein